MSLRTYRVIVAIAVMLLFALGAETYAAECANQTVTIFAKAKIEHGVCTSVAIDTPGCDVIKGYDGCNDLIYAGPCDVICTGTGNDRITIDCCGLGGSQIHAGGGSDIVDCRGGNVFCQVISGSGNDTVRLGRAGGYVRDESGADIYSIVSGNGRKDTIYDQDGYGTLISGQGSIGIQDDIRGVQY